MKYVLRAYSKIKDAMYQDDIKLMYDSELYKRLAVSWYGKPKEFSMGFVLCTLTIVFIELRSWQVAHAAKQYILYIV